MVITLSFSLNELIPESLALKAFWVSGWKSHKRLTENFSSGTCSHLPTPPQYNRNSRKMLWWRCSGASVLYAEVGAPCYIRDWDCYQLARRFSWFTRAMLPNRALGMIRTFTPLSDYIPSLTKTDRAIIPWEKSTTTTVSLVAAAILSAFSLRSSFAVKEGQTEESYNGPLF